MNEKSVLSELESASIAIEKVEMMSDAAKDEVSSSSCECDASTIDNNNNNNNMNNVNSDSDNGKSKSPSGTKDGGGGGGGGKYPKIVFLIILNEFCERFSYYGIRTVLFIYLKDFVGVGADTATVIYHVFTVVCYFTPLVGAILADGYIGLYATILSLSVVYFVGELILTITSIEPLGTKTNNKTCSCIFPNFKCTHTC